MIDTEGSVARPRTTPARERRVRPGGGRGWRIAAPVLTVIVLVALWQAVTTWGGVDPTTVPSPARVASAGWGDREQLGEATWATTQITLVGLLGACVAAVLVATALTFVVPLRHTVLPLLIAAQSVPIVVLAPLFIIWFGFGAGPKMVLVAVVSMLPLTISLLQGLTSADPRAVTLLRSMGAGPLRVFWKLRIPTALPHFVTGLRIVTGFIVVSAIFSEYVGARSGLGIYMQSQKNLFRTDLVFAAVVISVVIGLLLFAATHLLEVVLMPWERRRKAAQR